MQQDEVLTLNPPSRAIPLLSSILDELKLTLALGLPMVMATVGSMAMGIVNTMVIGRVSAEALAGVAAGNAIFWPVMTIGYGLMNGLDTVVAQAYGQQRLAECDQALGQGLLISLVVAAIITPLLYFGSDYYYLVGAQPDVVQHATPYIKALSLSYLPLLVFYAFQRYWQAQGVAAIFTVIILLANLVNYLGAVVFVYGLWGMPVLGVAGLGYATLLSRLFCCAMIVMLSLRLWHKPATSRFGIAFNWRDLIRWQQGLMQRLLRLGLPAAGQVSLEVSAFALTTTLVAGLGAITLAAHHVVMTIATFTFMFPLGLASASSVRVGTLIGQQRHQQARQAGWIGIVAGATIMGMFALVMCAIPRPLMMIFTNDTRVIDLGMTVILLAALFQVFDGTQVVSTGVLRGAGNTKLAFFSNLLGYYVIGLPLGILLCFWFSWHLKGLWLGLALGLIVTAICNTICWKRYRIDSVK